MASMSLLADQFSQGSLNSNLWSSTVNGAATTSYATTGASINLPSAATSSDWAFVNSVSSFDLTNSYAYVQFTAVPNPATQVDLNFYLCTATTQFPGTHVAWNYQGGSLNAIYNTGAGQTTVGTFTYSATTHRWWRIREAAGTIYWDTSPDGVNWTQQFSHADPITVTALFVEIECGPFQNETNPGGATFNDFNFNPGWQQGTVPVPPGFRSPMAWRAHQFPRPANRSNCIQLSNTGAGGTAGVAVTSGNSGGASGQAFDAVNGIGQFVYDSTYLIHGPMSWRVSTGATVAQIYAGWAAGGFAQFPESPPAWPQVWFRFYFLTTQIPAANNRLMAFFDSTASNNICGALLLLTNGQLRWSNAGAGTIITSTTVVSTGQWVRCEGFLVGSSASGQAEMKLFVGANVDGTIPDETVTSTATQSTNQPIGAARLGQTAGAIANYGPIWFSSWAISTCGYIGPVGVGVNPASATQRIYVSPMPPGFLSPMAWERENFSRPSPAVTPSVIIVPLANSPYRFRPYPPPTRRVAGQPIAGQPPLRQPPRQRPPAGQRPAPRRQTPLPPTGPPAGKPPRPSQPRLRPQIRSQQPIPAPSGEPLPIYAKPKRLLRIPAAFVRSRRQQVVPPVWVPVRIPVVRRVVLLPTRRGRAQTVPGGLPPLPLKRRLLLPLAWLYARRRSGLVPPVVVVGPPPTPYPSRQPIARWFGLRPIRRQQQAPPAPSGFPLPDYPKPQRPALARWLGFRWKRTQQVVPPVQAPPVVVAPPYAIPRRLRALVARRAQAQPVPPTLPRLSARGRKPLSLVGARPRPRTGLVPAAPTLAQAATRRARLAGLLRRLTRGLPIIGAPPPVAMPGHVTIINFQVESIVLAQAAPAAILSNSQIGAVVLSNAAPGVALSNQEVGRVGVSNA